MKKTMIVGLLGALLGVAAGTSAQAQTSDAPVQRPISIKIGAFFPSNGTVKNATNSTWIKLGADYAFTKTTSTNPALTSVYFDYTGDSKHGANVNLYALGLAERYYFGPSGAGAGTSVSPYAGAGIGVDFTHASGGGQSKDNTQIGGKVFVGAELNSGPFIEAAYNILPQSIHSGGSSVRLDGFDVSLGYRF